MRVIQTKSKFYLCLCFALSFVSCLSAQTSMQNVAGRFTTCLNGTWQVIIDPSGVGNWMQVWKEKKALKKTDFVEYAFDEKQTLNVPGDFNTQLSELKYYESTIWYKKSFSYTKQLNKRTFIHFGAVNYMADVYLNGELLGSHEGGFTPFQFEITKKIQSGENTIIVKVNSQKRSDGIPGSGYDWFNYGGITRDVNLVETGETFIEDYNIQLKQNSNNEVVGWVKVDGSKLSQRIQINIPELKIKYNTQTDNNGLAPINFKTKFQCWSPDNPKLYKVLIQSGNETITDEIGFRNITINGSKILLNGKPLFLKGVNIHEEIPTRAAKACTEADALILLNWAKELGCNFVRLAHYPHSEHTVKLAEKMGLLVWEELPIYQHIEFSNPRVEQKMDLMLKEMIKRDRNRCAIIIWSLSNETYHSTTNRDKALINLANTCHILDSTRLTTTVICTQGYNNNTIDVNDTLYRHFDVMSVNEYLGWYSPWQGAAKDTKWKFVCPNKPLIISEFGGEAVYGNHDGPTDEAAFWTEEYQATIYKNQLDMFANTPNLAGVCPWILVDFRSMSRLHPVYQRGWNRKGLLSDKGEKKQAWYIMKEYYKLFD